MASLITGASGFVAQHLADYITSQGESVIKTSLENEKKDDTYFTLDICNFENCVEIIDNQSPDIIYHLAGIAAPMQCEKNFNLAMNVNVMGVYNILKACEILSKKTKVIVISSSECYGKVSSKLMPINEDFECHPVNNYGLSKLMAEQVAQKFMCYSKNHDLKCVIARPFNHIGPRQSFGFVVPDFCMQIAKIVKGLQEPYVSVGNLEAKRDFTDVRDIVKGYYLLGQYADSGVYNLCSGTPHKIQEILDILIDISGISIEIRKDESKMRPSDVPLFIGDSLKIQKEFSWKPEISFRKSIEDTYQYILNSIK